MRNWVSFMSYDEPLEVIYAKDKENILSKSLDQQNKLVKFLAEQTMTSKEETTLMNAGEINSRNKLNATVNNNPVKGDIDCLIFFNPIDYHNSFDTFNFHSHHMNDFYF